MMHFVKTHTIQGKNSLQKAIIDVVEHWNGTLIDDDDAKKAFIANLHKMTESLNKDFPKCRPCQMTEHDNGPSFSTQGCDDTFATIALYEVKATYDGITRWKEKEGGKQ